MLEYGASVEEAMAAKAAATAAAILKKKPTAKDNATTHVKKADTTKGLPNTALKHM